MLIDRLKPTEWDERRRLVIPGNFTMTLAFCLEHFISIAQQSIKDHGKFFVALSGGSTPRAIFEHLCMPPYQSQIDWANVVLFWSDERSVPPNHKDSNYRMAMDAGLKEMPIPPSQIHRMPAEENIEENALSYEKTVLGILKDRPFDLMMLGMGDDGHTASLFPETEGLKARERLVIANYIPKMKTWRMTLTFDGIHRSRNIALYVLGAEKKYMLAKVMLSSEIIYPSQQVGTKEHPALWIADDAAADELMLEIAKTKKTSAS